MAIAHAQLVRECATVHECSAETCVCGELVHGWEALLAPIVAYVIRCDNGKQLLSLLYNFRENLKKKIFVFLQNFLSILFRRLANKIQLLQTTLKWFCTIISITNTNKTYERSLWLLFVSCAYNLWILLIKRLFVVCQVINTQCYLLAKFNTPCYRFRKI